MKRLITVALVASLGIIPACGDNSSPSSPSGAAAPATPTRIINLLGGSLNIGTVQVGSAGSAAFNIRNDGNSTLTVSGITGPCAGTSTTATWTSGQVPAASQQSVTVNFKPVTVQNCSGTITVNGDQTSGTNTIGITATSTLDGIPILLKGGSGDTVFDLPVYITRIRITADYGGFSSNFIVKIAGRLVVNELVGTTWKQTHFDGVYAIAGGGTVEVTNSSGVAWLFTEQR